MATAKRARVEDEGEGEEEDALDDDVDIGKLNTFSITPLRTTLFSVPKGPGGGNPPTPPVLVLVVPKKAWF